MGNNGQSYERLFTVRQVAKILHVNESTVRKWIREGSLEAIELPKRGNRRTYYRIRKSTVDAIVRVITG